MADAKLTALTPFTPITTDLLYGVDDPGGTPVSGPITVGSLFTLFSLDEDTMSSDSATKWPTQQSVKAYVDTLAATVTTEAIQDLVGAMFSGNTETLVTVTYQDSDGTMDVVVSNDLSAYSNTSSKFVKSDPTGVTGADQITNSMSLTTAEYAAIGSPNASTLYYITDAT